MSTDHVKADPADVVRVATAIERFGAAVAETIEGAKREAAAGRVRAMEATARRAAVLRGIERELVHAEAVARHSEAASTAVVALRQARAAAEQHLAVAHRAARLTDDAIASFSSSCRVRRSMVEQHVASGTSAVKRYAEALGDYMNTDVTSGSSSVSAMGAAVTDVSSLPAAFAMAALSDIDDSDAGVRAFEKVSRADMEWGVEQLHRVVLPAVRRGKDSAYFAARDAAEGLSGDRSYEAVFRAFFDPKNAIKLSRRRDGKLEVANGYHRLRVARELGIHELPAVVRE